MQTFEFKTQNKEFIFLLPLNVIRPQKPIEPQKTTIKYQDICNPIYELIKLSDLIRIANDSDYKSDEVYVSAAEYGDAVVLETKEIIDNPEYNSQYVKYLDKLSKYNEQVKSYNKIVNKQLSLRKEATEFAFQILKKHNIESYEDVMNETYIKYPDAVVAINMITWLNQNPLRHQIINE